MPTGVNDCEDTHTLTLAAVDDPIVPDDQLSNGRLLVFGNDTALGRKAPLASQAA